MGGKNGLSSIVYSWLKISASLSRNLFSQWLGYCGLYVPSKQEFCRRFQITAIPLQTPVSPSQSTPGILISSFTNFFIQAECQLPDIFFTVKPRRAISGWSCLLHGDGYPIPRAIKAGALILSRCPLHLHGLGTVQGCITPGGLPRVAWFARLVCC